MSEYLLEILNVSKSFPGVKALNDVSLRLKPGRVHALMGENGAGKSTLMKCLFGIYHMDEGHILINGKETVIRSPMDALSKGIAMVHQELQPIPERTVAENVYLGRHPLKGKHLFHIVDHRKMYEDTDAVLKSMNFTFSSHSKIKDLSISQMQCVEIAKAVSANCKILILDEPTSSLTLRETDKLFEIIRKLKSEGVAIVYISHKMDEILRISDEITVMRDGCSVGTWQAKDLSINQIITHMVGRELSRLFPPRVSKIGNITLKVENFTSDNSKSFKDVSFELKEGEILGIGGLMGAQRTELAEGIFGMRGHSKGKVIYKGRELDIKKPEDAIENGIVLLTEDRRGSGIMGDLSVQDNAMISSLRNYIEKNLYLSVDKMTRKTQGYVNSLNIKTPSIKTAIKNLSGGNQQKVLIGRWLATNPEVFLLDEPTRGIDVGAKYEIYSIINELADSGKSVILISSEMEELIGMSDRIMVMCEGKVSGFLNKEEMSQENIMNMAVRFS